MCEQEPEVCFYVMVKKKMHWVLLFYSCCYAIGGAQSPSNMEDNYIVKKVIVLWQLNHKVQKPDFKTSTNKK